MVYPSESLNHAAIEVAGAEGIVAHERVKEAQRQDHRGETEREVRRREDEITVLRDKRHAARIALCERLGDFGFAYDAESHGIVRLSLIAPPEPETEAPTLPSVAQPFDPKSYDVPEPERKERSVALVKALEVVSWIAVPFLGAFIGYSIGLLAGLPVKASLPVAGLAMAFGVALLSGMKASIYSMMYVSARRNAAGGGVGWAAAALAVCVLLIAAEAGLGAFAIVRYSQDRALRPDEVLPWGAAMLIALCFSTPVLLTSLAKGAYDGATFDDRVGRVRREAERFHREQAEAVRAHEAALRARDEAARARHAEELAAFQEADEKYRTDDRWKSAMSLFGAIGALDKEIADREKRLTDYQIGRGYALSAQGGS